MVNVDHVRCAYCGGCVAVCPVGALTLAETRLVVDGICVGCGDCVPACPLGALALPEGRWAGAGPAGRHFKPSYDLVVVGAGPGGSVAAQTAAAGGLSVLLLEKRQEIGSPVRCAEGIGRRQLLPFLEPDPRWVASEVNRAEIVVQLDDEVRTVSASGGRGYILERRLFDRVLAERAAQAGAEVRVKAAVTGLLQDGGRVRGVRVRDGLAAGDREVEVTARVVIAADGVEAQVGRWAGLELDLSLADTMVCAQYLLAGVEVDPGCTCYVIDHRLAPGGYLWVFPKGAGAANVGLGVQADLWRDPGTALDHLDRFVESRPSLARGYPVTLVAGNVPVAMAGSRLVTDGFMVVGDAARQVDPLTGGGIASAMTAGRLAAEVTVGALAAGDTSAGFLSRYQSAWRESMGRKQERNYCLRARFPPERRGDERFARAFALAAAG